MTDPGRRPRILCAVCSAFVRALPPDATSGEDAEPFEWESSDCGGCMDAWLTKAGYHLRLAELFAFDG